MSSGLTDTDEQTAAVHLAMLRQATPDQRLALALSLSRSVVALTRDAIARAMPDASGAERGVEFVSRCYGVELADGVRAHLAVRRP